MKYYENYNFYHMKSEDLNDGVLLEKFPAFQQETEQTCAPACVRMVLAYYGNTSFSEEELARECKTLPFPIGTRLKPVVECFNRLGFQTYSSIESQKDNNGLTFSNYEQFRDFVRSSLKRGEPIIVENVDYGGHYKVIIGFDKLSEDVQHDILIFADPYDSYDGVREGYNYFPAERFFYMWFDHHCIEKEYSLQAFIVVKRKV